MKFVKIACILFISASITWSCSQDSSGNKKSKQDSKKQVQQQTQSPVLQTTPSGETDQFGRKPGDQHYGHNHGSNEPHTPTPTNTQPAAPTGGPDKYGRNPGDQHYGHDHE